jgi:hypothetical protein
MVFSVRLRDTAGISSLALAIAALPFLLAEGKPTIEEAFQ